MRLILLVSLAVFALDQVTKHLVMNGMGLLERGVIDVAPPFLRFVMAWNKGVNFGVFASNADTARWALIGLALVVSAVLFFWAARRRGAWFHVGAGFVIGGAIGNAVDRVRFGAVADFLNMSCCGLDNPYVFNIADVAIFAGAAVLIFSGGSGAQKRA
ncbi:MAG: signal peptidase II [Paracoccaceae bacterium]